MRGLAGSRRGSTADAAAGGAAVAGDQAPGSPKPPPPPPPVVARDAPVEEVERFIAVTVDKVLEIAREPESSPPARARACLPLLMFPKETGAWIPGRDASIAFRRESGSENLAQSATCCAISAILPSCLSGAHFPPV